MNELSGCLRECATGFSTQPSRVKVVGICAKDLDEPRTDVIEMLAM